MHYLINEQKLEEEKKSPSRLIELIIIYRISKFVKTIVILNVWRIRFVFLDNLMEKITLTLLKTPLQVGVFVHKVQLAKINTINLKFQISKQSKIEIHKETNTNTNLIKRKKNREETEKMEEEEILTKKMSWYFFPDCLPCVFF